MSYTIKRIKIKLLLRKPKFMWLWHIIFWFYYKRLPEFYKQYPPIKAFLHLVGNYNHLQDVILPGEQKLQQSAHKDADQYWKELCSLRLQMSASSLPKETIRKLSKMFAIEVSDN